MKKDLLLKNWHIKIACILLAIILWAVCRFNNLSERFFSVPLQVFDSEVSTPSVEIPPMVRVHLRGEPNSLFPIQEADVEPYVDLSGCTTEGTYQLPVLYSLRGTALDVSPLEVIIEPSDITVSVERKLTKQVSISPVVKGIPADGYEYIGYQTNPSNVELSGPRSIIESIGDCPTNTIDIVGRNGSFEITVPYDLPTNLVKVNGIDTVSVKVDIQEKIENRDFENIPIAFKNENFNLSLRPSSKTCVLKLRSSLSEFKKLKLSADSVFVNCLDIKEPGRYSLKLQTKIPKGIEVLSITPTQIEVYADASNPNGVLRQESGGES